MKQRHHRKAVQRRMREAPTQYDRDCQFYGGVAWTKRERKAIAKGKPAPLLFNMIPKTNPDVKAAADAFHAGEYRENQQAITDYVRAGMAWIEISLDDFKAQYPERG